MIYLHYDILYYLGFRVHLALRRCQDTNKFECLTMQAIVSFVR